MTSKLVKDPGHDLKLPLKFSAGHFVYNKLIKKDKKH